VELESELESESESDSTLESKFLYRGGNSPGSNRCFKDLLGREEGNRDGRRGRRKLGGKKGGKRGRRERGGKAAAVREREREMLARTHAHARTHTRIPHTHSLIGVCQQCTPSTGARDHIQNGMV